MQATDNELILSQLTELRQQLTQSETKITALQAQVNAFYLGTPDGQLLAMTKERDAALARLERALVVIKAVKRYRRKLDNTSRSGLCTSLMNGNLRRKPMAKRWGPRSNETRDSLDVILNREKHAPENLVGTVSCKFCRQKWLTWKETEDGKWILIDEDGDKHECKSNGF